MVDTPRESDWGQSSVGGPPAPQPVGGFDAGSNPAPPPFRGGSTGHASEQTRPLSQLPAIAQPPARPPIPAPQLYQPVPAAGPRRADVPVFFFDGGAATYFGTGLLAVVVIVCSLGIATPFALVLFERWRATHTYIEGRRLMFTGTGLGLFGSWLKWWLLILVTVGIYSFWVIPRLTKWRIEHQAFDPRG
jgi:hypothetical protein